MLQIQFEGFLPNANCILVHFSAVDSANAIVQLTIKCEKIF